MEKLISVVVPVYNVELYLEKCIESIINQTYKNLEIILVDDGATDRSGKICDDYSQKDSRIKVIHKQNGGLSEARNAGIEIACGDYIAFVDSDDFIHPKMYETMMNIMRKDHSDMIVCGITPVSDQAEIDQNMKIPNDSDRIVNGVEFQHMYFDRKYAQTVVVAWNKLYSRRMFQTLRFPKGKLHEDEYTTYKITYPCKQISYVETGFYYYVTRSTSIMGSFTEKRFDLLLSYIERMKYFSDRKETQLAECFIKRYMRMSNQYRVWYTQRNQDFSASSAKCKRRFRREYKRCKKQTSFSLPVRLEAFLYLFAEKIYMGVWQLHTKIARKEFFCEAGK